MQSVFLPLSLLALLLYAGAGISQETPATPETPETEHEATQIELEGVPFQQVLDQLFGTSETTGLLNGEGPFVLRAEDIVLTSEQAQNFFSPTSPSEADFVALITAAEELRGKQIRIEGLVDGEPFEFMLSGRQIKLEGISLTQAELDALVADLQAIPGLHEAKIEATLDGELTVVKLQNVPGRVKIEVRDHDEDLDDDIEEIHESENRGRGSENHERSEHAELAEGNREHASEHTELAEGNREHGSIERTERMEKVDKVERVERTERPEMHERVERTERIERIERPDIEHGGRGRD
jgi:hypothetical protein